MSRRAGMILILASGFLVMLSLVGVALVVMSRQTVPAAAAALARTQAALAAESGMGYAAARLSAPALQAPIPTVANRCDDWTYRQGGGERVEGAGNPSFSHGEHWEDTPGVPDGDGRYDPGLDVVTSPKWTDLDGDGRFSAWTGRLRNKIPFSLSIESVGSKVPVNSGGDVDAPVFNDVNAKANKGLIHLLNNLGVFLLTRPDGTPMNEPGRRDVPAGVPLGSAEPIPLSELGTHLVLNRPKGGYPDAERIGTVLDGLGYSPAAVESILPCLDVGPYETLVEGRLNEPIESRDALIELRTAPKPILAGVWLYYGDYTPNRLAEAGAWTRPYSRVGGILPFSAVQTLLFPDEAELLAEEAVSYRKTNDPSWLGLATRLFDRRSVIFQRDLADLPGLSIAANTWCARKIDVALSAASGIRLGAVGSRAGLWGWDVDPAQAGIQPPVCGACNEKVSTFPRPGTGDAWYPDGKAPYIGTIPPSDRWAPVRLTLAPPVRFLVRSAAQGSRREGRLRVAERLEIFSQSDFDNLGSEALAARGIQALSPSGGHRPDREDFVPRVDFPADPPRLRTYPQTATGPRWNYRSCAQGAALQQRYRQLRTVPGFVGLAGREKGSQYPYFEGSNSYWPFREDFDGNPANDLNNDNGGNPFPPFYDLCGPYRLGFEEARWIQLGYGAPGNPGKRSLEAWFSWPDTGMPVSSTDGIYMRLASVAHPHQPGLLTPELEQTDTEYVYIRGSRVVQGSPVATPGTNFRVDLQVCPPFNPLFPPPPPIKLDLSVFVPDVDPLDPGRVNDAYHVVLTFMNTGAATRFFLTVNGYKSPMKVGPWNCTLQGAGSFYGIFRGIDELESYGIDNLDYKINNYVILEPDRILRRAALGRFVAPGYGAGNPDKNPLYRSARYVLGSGARLLGFHWTWLGFHRVAGEIGSRLTLKGSDSLGNPLFEDRPDPNATWTPAGGVPLAAFEFDLEFFDPDTASPENPMIETPTLRSVWVTFTRPGHAPVWSSWKE